MKRPHQAHEQRRSRARGVARRIGAALLIFFAASLAVGALVAIAEYLGGH